MNILVHKDIAKVLISQKEIENIVKSLAKQLEKDYNGKDFMLVGLLKGSVVFMADLIRSIQLDFAIDFITASSYSGTQSKGAVKILKDISQPVKDKDVLIVEDVVDSGVTLDFVVKHLLDLGAKSVKICTMFDKPRRRKKEVQVDYIGMTMPDEFIVGYGLDYNEKYRNLPYVGVLKPEVYS